MTQEQFDELVSKVNSKTADSLKTSFYALKSDELADLFSKSKANTENLSKLKENLEEISLEFKQWNEKREEMATKSLYKQVGSFLEEKKDDLEQIVKSKSGVVELRLKAPENITTGSAAFVNTEVPAISGVQMAAPSNVNLRQDAILGLVSVTNTNQPAYAYSETFPKEGDYTFVAEGEAKPQIDFSIRTKFAEPKKIAAWIRLTDESVQDIPRLQSIATDYLLKKHNRKKASFIINGDAAAGIDGLADVARTFVAGDMALSVQNPNAIDVINAAVTDIMVTQNYQDEMPYMANTVLMHPTDFFLNFVSAKTTEGTPLYPTASLYNEVVIGGVRIVPSLDIAIGKIFVADLSKYNVTNYIPYTVKIGFVNDDFIKNQFVILGESRFHAFVKELDKAAFIYDDIATILTAISA